MQYEDQLDFPVIYASGRDGWAIKDMKDDRTDLTPLLEAIINDIPAPPTKKEQFSFRL